ncbi:hypothetical protein FB451DRAFT_1336743 [Mycena latifolia]|nr:hypothetical protein FB451DRAFT_1336743 [Mycena latifolia]
MDAQISIRLVDHADIPQITSIANHYIQSSALPESAILETYLSIRAQGLPYIVAVATDLHTVLGYAYASGYRMPSHKAYCHTVEITVFVDHKHHTQRVGSSLMNDLMSKLRNPASLQTEWALSVAPEISEVLYGGFGLRDWYGRWGFKEVGRLKRVGFKFDIWLDTLILQLSLKPDDSIDLKP